jgi:hypothetical protein
MSRIALALALLALLAPTPVEAHCFARWYYPWPQRRCGVAHVALHKIIVAPNRNDFAPNRNDFEIALPGLAQADLDGGGADEPTRARLLLRAALEAANGH